MMPICTPRIRNIEVNIVRHGLECFTRCVCEESGVGKGDWEGGPLASASSSEWSRGCANWRKGRSEDTVKGAFETGVMVPVLDLQVMNI